MPVQYPAFLPKPLQQGYSRTESPQFEEADVQAGPPIKQRNTFDTPATYTLEFVFSKAQATLFRAWFVSQLDYGLKPFVVKMFNDGEIIEQEVSFTATGIAQITSTVATHTRYSAEVRARKINSAYSEENYDDLFAIAELSPNGDYLKGASTLSEIVNQILPTVDFE